VMLNSAEQTIGGGGSAAIVSAPDTAPSTERSR
jgi:hypothetical protein